MDEQDNEQEDNADQEEEGAEDAVNEDGDEEGEDAQKAEDEDENSLHKESIHEAGSPEKPQSQVVNGDAVVAGSNKASPVKAS